jgi:hypothetical protein
MSKKFVPGLTLQTPAAFRAQHAPDIKPSKRGTVGNFKKTLEWDADLFEMYSAFMRALCSPENLYAAGLIPSLDLSDVKTKRLARSAAQDIAEGHRVAMAASRGAEPMQFEDGSRGYRQADYLMGARLIDGHPEQEPTEEEELKLWMRANAARWARRWKKINAIQAATGFSLLVRWRGYRDFKSEGGKDNKSSVYLNKLGELLIQGVQRARAQRSRRVERFRITAHEYLAALPRNYRPETPSVNSRSQIAKKDAEHARLAAGGAPHAKQQTLPPPSRGVLSRPSQTVAASPSSSSSSIHISPLSSLNSVGAVAGAADALAQVCDALESGASPDELPANLDDELARLGEQYARLAALLAQRDAYKDSSSYKEGSRSTVEIQAAAAPDSEATFSDSTRENLSKIEDKGQSHYTSACSDEMVYPPHSCPSPDVDAEEINERMAVICEASGIALSTDESGFEDDADRREEANKQARRDLCETCRSGMEDGVQANRAGVAAHPLRL